nr:MAG TPA: hypothetical protein [Caudoviricetes sp.]
MSEKYLGLMGPEDSVYLRLIQREAEQAGLPVLWVSQRDERCGCYVIDSEAGDVNIRLTAEEDIDCVQHPGLSCVAEAAFRYVHRMLMPLSVVGLIGRRHAVQGLGEALVRSGHAVLPCNRAMHPWRALYGAQIFVNSAPGPDWELRDAVWQGRHRIIDISGSLEQLTQRFDWKGIYISRGEIGRKNVEILLDRAQAVLNETKEVNNETL